MNKGLGYFAMFVTGLAIGSVATWQYTKNYYEQRAQEEIDSVKEVFSKKFSKEDSTNTHESKKELQEAQTKYSEKVNELGYTDYSRSAAQQAKVEVAPNTSYIGSEPIDKPYVISPDELGEIDDYEVINLTYYADGVLTDDCDEIVEDIENTVGRESLNHFGDYEDDAVHVRNDRLKADYEILLDVRTYEEVLGNKPDYI